VRHSCFELGVAAVWCPFQRSTSTTATAPSRAHHPPRVGTPAVRSPTLRGHRRQGPHPVAADTGPERAFRPKSLTDAVVRTALILAAFGAQSLIREVSIPNPTRSAWRGGRPTALPVCLSALWSAFIIGHRSGDSQFGSFGNVAGWPTAYAAAFLLYIAYVAADVMLGCWRYAKPADGSLQLGLRLMAIGCATTVIRRIQGRRGHSGLAHSSPISASVEAGRRDRCRPRSAADRRGRCPSGRRTKMASCPQLVSPICGPRQAVSLMVCLDRRLPRSRARSVNQPHARPTPHP